VSQRVLSYYERLAYEKKTSGSTDGLTMEGSAMTPGTVA
jgi:hypothetical protein